MRLQVKLTPHSARSGIAGWMGEALKVRVAAAAERGRANEALREVLAEALSPRPGFGSSPAGQPPEKWWRSKA